MKIRKRLGNDSVQDLIEHARKRAVELPDKTVRDEWPRSERCISQYIEVE